MAKSKLPPQHFNCQWGLPRPEDDGPKHHKPSTLIPIMYITSFRCYSSPILPLLYFTFNVFSHLFYLGSVRLLLIIIWISEYGLFNYHGLDNYSPDSQSNQSYYKNRFIWNLVRINPSLVFDCSLITQTPHPDWDCLFNYVRRCFWGFTSTLLPELPSTHQTVDASIWGS